MQELKEVIQNGWPNRKYDVPPSVMIYFDVWYSKEKEL
jgi:hypothetical protein